MCVCCPGDLSMNSPVGVFPNRARDSDRIERKNGKKGGGGLEKQSKSKRNKGGA